MRIPVKTLHDPARWGGSGKGKYRWAFWVFPWLLLLSISLVYWPVKDFPFIDYDDNMYIVENGHLQGASTFRFLAWAFTDTSTGHWHPVTWLSHRMDWLWYGPNAGGHHVTSVLIHFFNSLLLYFLLVTTTRQRDKSALVAFLFAVHPLNVESVAWIAERKNVLSLFFGLAALWAYSRYVLKPAGGMYLLAALLFLLGLLTKPMLVVLPVLMLLWDYWPLGRLEKVTRRGIGRLILEKVPFFLFAMGSVAMTLRAAGDGGAIRDLEAFPLSVRILNSVSSYVIYLKKIIFPQDLAFYYPYPSSFSLLFVLASGCFLILIAIYVWQKKQNQPAWITGWFWYLVSLLPVIGLVQVGYQSMADRYIYLPMIGLLTMVAWGLPRWDRCRSVRCRALSLAVCCLVIIVLSILARQQVLSWRSSSALAEQAFAVTRENHMAHLLMGNILYERKDLAGAAFHYERALLGRPNASEIHNNIGNIQFLRGNRDQALRSYEQAVAYNPRNAKALNNLGVVLLERGDREGAVRHFQAALRIDPLYPSPRRYLESMGLGPTEDSRGKP